MEIVCSEQDKQSHLIQIKNCLLIAVIKFQQTASILQYTVHSEADWVYNCSAKSLKNNSCIQGLLMHDISFHIR